MSVALVMNHRGITRRKNWNAFPVKQDIAKILIYIMGKMAIAGLVYRDGLHQASLSVYNVLQIISSIQIMHAKSVKPVPLANKRTHLAMSIQILNC